MSAADKARNAAEDLTGRAKEAAGVVTGNDELREKGRTEQAEADVKMAAEDVKDAFGQ
jgi:uncharacterized protein YjbJ (UPF0337 family)